MCDSTNLCAQRASVVAWLAVISGQGEEQKSRGGEGHRKVEEDHVIPIAVSHRVLL